MVWEGQRASGNLAVPETTTQIEEKYIPADTYGMSPVTIGDIPSCAARCVGIPRMTMFRIQTRTSGITGRASRLSKMSEWRADKGRAS